MSWSRRAQIGFMASLLVIGALVGSSIAQTRDPRLADLTEPGSVIIFPKFIRGALTVDGVPNQPRTEISIGVVCPPGFFCAEGDKVKIKFHWVCGSDQNPVNSFVCDENDFEALFTVNGKIIFNPEGTTAPGNFISPAPLCDRGYLIGWVIDTFDRPIKFDGLTGTAVLRESPTAVTAYKGITIQAHPALANRGLIVLDAEGTGPAQTRGLPFSGLPGQYQAVTGVLMGDIEYDKVTAPSHTTVLTLLTLDTRSNRGNYPTHVDFDIWNAITAVLLRHQLRLLARDRVTRIVAERPLGLHRQSEGGFQDTTSREEAGGWRHRHGGRRHTLGPHRGSGGPHGGEFSLPR